MTTTEAIHPRLTDACEPAHLDIDEQSSLHAGHVGDRAHGGGHYTVAIVAEKFDGLSLMSRHRMVYDGADELMKQEVQALSMKTYTPAE